MPDFTIDSMTAADWPEVRAIYAEGIATGIATFEREAPDWATWDRDHLAECRFVARGRNGEMLGWAALSPYSRRRVYEGVADLSVYVAAVARGRGVGRALIRELVAASEQAGLWTLQAGVIAHNEASLRLHDAAGFRRVGVRERIGRDYADRWTDVVLLERRSRTVGID